MASRSSDPRFAALDAALDTALAPWRRSVEPIAVLFSGGVDSGLLAYELREAPGLRLVTVGLAGSADLEAAAEGARVLDLSWAGSVLTRDEVADMAHRLEPDLRDASPMIRSISIALGCAIARAPSSPVLCGQGADELFLGYAHYATLDAQEAEIRAEEDLTRLRTRDWPLTVRIAGHLGREIVAPYLEPAFVEAARSVPLALRRANPEPKAFFRSFAEHRGLAHALARRPKRALQYGSGVERALRNASRSPMRSTAARLAVTDI